eukprot:scaffold177439_cov46-Attheya_sp.AAC.2
MSANTRAAERGTIHKAAESPDESIMKMRFDHGLCVTCSVQIFEVTGTGGRRKLNPMATPGVAMNGRCIYCHPEQKSHAVNEEEQNWEDAATVPVEEVETGEDTNDQSLPPVIELDGYDNQCFVGVVLEGNVKKGKGIFSHVVKTGEHKGESIVYEGEFADGFFEGRGSVRDQGKGCVCVCEGQLKKSKLHGQSKVTFEDGNMYEGELKNNTRDGHGTSTEANGNRYEGEWKNDEYDGQGTYAWAGGGRYEGEWKNGMKNGNGKKVDEDGEIYEGNWKDNLVDGGQGTYTRADDGDRYEGEFKNDRMNGNGKVAYEDGTIYEGNWKDGKRDGQGTYTYDADGGCEDAGTVPVEEVETGEDINDQALPPIITLYGINEQRFVGVIIEGNIKKGKGKFQYVDETGEHKGKSVVYEGDFADGFFEGHGSLRDEGGGYVSEGQWKKSKRHGHFKETYESGDMYEGEMKNDMANGHGVSTEANGDHYEGEWKNNEYDGQGTYTRANGDHYEGEWKNNLMTGNGKVVFKDGDMYEGNWKDDKRDGQGTFTWPDGGHCEGEWKNNLMNGIGKLFEPNGITYEGNWKDGDYDGQGTHTSANGDRYEGEWEHNMMNGNGKNIYKNGAIYQGTYTCAEGRVKVGTWLEYV